MKKSGEPDGSWNLPEEQLKTSGRWPCCGTRPTEVRRPSNVVSRLFLRSLTGNRKNARPNAKLLRTLIEAEHRSFRQVWEKRTYGPIYFDGYLYFSNFRIWHKDCFLDGMPHLQYNRCRRSSWRIEDAIRYETPFTHIDGQDTTINGLQSTAGEQSAIHRPSLLTLTSDGWLVRYELKANKWLELKRIYLSERYHFKHLSWETHYESFVLKSIHFYGPAQARTPHTTNSSINISHKPYIYLAFFEFPPLCFKGLFGIRKEVFGHDLVDVSLSNGMLITMHKKGDIRFYCLSEILTKFTIKPFSLEDSVNLDENNDHIFGSSQISSAGPLLIGRHPAGIPCNIDITCKPSLMFKVNSFCHAISFGGFPWHCIVKPHKQDSLFNVYDIVTNTIYSSVQQEFDGLPFGEEKAAFFHADQSGRILSVEQKSVT